MKRFFVVQSLAIAILTSVSAYGQQTGIAAFKVFGREQGTVSLSRAVGMVGFYGQHQPKTWRVLVQDPVSPAHLREYLLESGHVVGERRFERKAEQDFPSIPLSQGALKVDSDQAFITADRAAKQAGVGFDGVHYQLRCRDLRNEPIWMMNLIDQMQRPVGTIYVSAQTGETIRKVWNQVGNPSYTQTPVASTNAQKPSASSAAQAPTSAPTQAQAPVGVVEPPVPQASSFGGKVKRVWKKVLPDKWVDEPGTGYATVPQ